MTTPRALFTPATWSEDDSDEEEHFREMVRLRIRHEERFKDVDDVNADDADADDAGNPLDPIWGEPPRTAGRAPRSPDSDVDENTDPWGDFGASPRRRKGGHDVDSTRRMMDDSWSPNATFMPRTAEVRGLTSELAKLGIDVPYHASPGAEGGADTAVHAAALGRETRAQGPRMKPPVDHRRHSSAKPRLKNNTMKPSFAVPASPAKPPLYAPPSSSSSRPRGRTPRRPTANRLTAIRHSKLTVEAYELISPGALKESIHRGVYAHLWWSGGRASDDSSGAEGADSEGGADCFPYPIGFTVRATLRGRGLGADDEDGCPKRLVGGVVRRSHHGHAKRSIGNDHPFDELGSGVCVVECCVEMSGASARKLANEPTHNSAWDGPCFRVTWMGGDASVLGSKVRKPRSKRWNGGKLTKPTGQGRTPSRALASLLETLGVKVPLHLPVNGDEVFGFSSGNLPDATRVRARLDELARVGGDVAPVRLREPSGVGLALVRRGAYTGTGVARDGPVVRSQNDDAKVVGSNPSLVAAAVATPDVYIGADGKGEYPLLPGYQVGFELAPGVHVTCGLVLKPVPKEPKGSGFEPRMVFKVERRDGPRLVESMCASAGDPERCWKKIPSLLRRCARDAVPARFAQGSDPSSGVSVSDDDRFDGIGAHLFGLESPIVLDLLKRARREWAAAGNDEHLIEKNVGEEGDGAVEFP